LNSFYYHIFSPISDVQKAILPGDLAKIFSTVILLKLICEAKLALMITIKAIDNKCRATA
jgi:hypothetical protein